MKKSKIWTTIIESIIVLMILSIWIIWVFNIFTKSNSFAWSTKNRLEAILIAREWVEAMTNIRDTNWKNFAANIQNCWNTLNYNTNCLINTSNNIQSWSYIIYKDTNNRWYLSWVTIWENSYSWTNYRNSFKVSLDSDWFYTQSWWIKDTSPLFTREIQVSYLSSTIPNQKMQVKSIVSWSDSWKDWIQKVELKTILTNWKKE